MDDEQDAAGQETSAAGLGGGMLSQDELDSLLAAAQHEEDAGLQGEGAFLSDNGPTDTGGILRGEDPAPPPVVSLPSFDAAPSPSAASSGAGMGRVRDIPLEVTVELGRTRLLIKDILDLGTGSIIELDKLAGEPVDLYANGLLMARGEVIVIDDNFGVRVTEIITAADRKREADANGLAA